MSVHEGPFHISKNCELKVRQGIICSIEPGCYFSKQIYKNFSFPYPFGIRIENLVAVVDARKYQQDITVIHPVLPSSIVSSAVKRSEFAERSSTDSNDLCFKTLALVPIMTEPLRRSAPLENKHQVDWLNNYHQVVSRSLMPFVQDDEQKLWLEKATLPV